MGRYNPTLPTTNRGNTDRNANLRRLQRHPQTDKQPCERLHTRVSKHRPPSPSYPCSCDRCRCRTSSRPGRRPGAAKSSARKCCKIPRRLRWRQSPPGPPPRSRPTPSRHEPTTTTTTTTGAWLGQSGLRGDRRATQERGRGGRRRWKCEHSRQEGGRGREGNRPLVLAVVLRLWPVDLVRGGGAADGERQQHGQGRDGQAHVEEEHSN